MKTRLPDHLGELRTRVLLDLFLKPESSIHIGVGDPVPAILRTFLKARIPGPDGVVEVPVVPSSTLKGAMRSLCEKLAKEMEVADELSSLAVRAHREDKKSGITHLPEGDEANVARKFLMDVLKGKNVEERKRFLLDMGLRPDDAEELAKNLGYQPGLDRATSLFLASYCLICKLFGSPGISGLLRISDAMPVKEPERMLYKYGVGIDRASLTARRGILYAHELLEPVVRLRAVLVTDNIEPGSIEARLLASLLELMSELELGLQVGARKSVGYGLLLIDEELSGAWFLDFRQTEPGEAAAFLANPRGQKSMSVRDLISLLRGGRH